MHEYYFKIKKDNIEFEFSTTDKFTFEQQLSDWINGVVRGDYVEPPAEATEPENQNEQNSQVQEKPQRSGFIDVKNLTSINDITTPAFNSSILPHEDKPEIESVNFEQTLEDSINNPKTEVIEKTDILSDFEGFLNSYNPHNSMDNLIITAMYILNTENKERFSIKQLNAKLVPVTGTPVDHAVIEDAISQNLVRIVPDLTGTSEFTEYTLTEDGEGYFVE